MSDPLMQIFCCFPVGFSSPTLNDFNPNLYNIICLASSLVGISGAIFQLLPRNESWPSLRWFSLTSFRGRQIIVWLAVADLLASLGVFLRSYVKLSDTTHKDTSVGVYCTILVLWTQYFYAVTWCWTLCYAVDTWLAVQRRKGFPWLYHCIAWFLPALIQLIIYMYSEGVCGIRIHISQLVNYSLVAAVMVFCPIVYWLAMNHLHTLTVSCLSQLTNKERSVIRTVGFRFGVIVIAFYICWLPNLLHGLLLYFWLNKCPKDILITLWYMMAVLNPLQALFNSLVYKRSNLKLNSPFRSKAEFTETTPLTQANINF